MVHISLLDLINKCSNGKKTNEEIFNDFSKFNRENIHEVFKYKKFNYDFTDYLTIYKDEENDDILGIIRPCYREFLATILRFLNVKGNRIDDEELTKDLLNQIEKLKGITTTTDLKNEFPYLFDDLITGRKYMNEVRKKDKKESQELKDYFYSCAMKESLNGFTETQSEAYRRYVTDRYKFGSKTLRTSYNEYIKENFDINKVAMYIADLYLNICESTDDLSIIDKYFKTLVKYEESNYDKHVYVKTKDNEEMNACYFELRMISLRKRIRELRNVKVNWDITQPSKSVKKVKESQRTMITSKGIENIKKIANAKEKFYSNHEPRLIVTGIKGLKGYIAYVYKNGEVILDKEPNYPKNAAMYHIKVIDFDELTKLGNQELKAHPKAEYIQHRKGWEEIIEKIITRKATPQEEEAVNEFKKKHQ